MLACLQISASTRANFRIGSAPAKAVGPGRLFLGAAAPSGLCGGERTPQAVRRRSEQSPPQGWVCFETGLQVSPVQSNCGAGPAGPGLLAGGLGSGEGWGGSSDAPHTDSCRETCRIVPHPSMCQLGTKCSPNFPAQSSWGHPWRGSPCMLRVDPQV